MQGVDDDPVMARMGFEKKFLFDLSLESDDAFPVSVIFVDTRTAEEKPIPSAEYRFLRTG